MSILADILTVIGAITILQVIASVIKSLFSDRSGNSGRTRHWSDNYPDQY